MHRIRGWGRAACGGASALLVGAMLFPGWAPLPAVAQDQLPVPDHVVLDGAVTLDRTEHDPCLVAVPAFIGGDIQLEVDFVAGTVAGWISGSGGGDQAVPASCSGEDGGADVWQQTTEFTGAVTNGTADRTTGRITAELTIDVLGSGSHGVPGHQYLCSGSDILTPTCPLPGIVTPQTATLSGVVDARGTTIGEFEWYTNSCVLITPEANTYGREGCPTKGTWEVAVSSVTWPPNADPVITSLGYEPADPTGDDTVSFTAVAEDADGDPLTYTWVVDNETQTVTGPTVTWEKPPPGDHLVVVTASDGKGGVSPESSLTVYVAEHVGAGDQDGDGVPDDEDVCPTEFGLLSNGCPEFTVALGCAPADPAPDDVVRCSTTVAGKRPGEELEFSWYLDGAAVGTGGPSWVWGRAQEGEHDIVVDVIGEGGLASASVVLGVGVNLVDEETAGFAISGLACSAGITSDDTLTCSASLVRTADDVGSLDVRWSIDGAGASAQSIPGGTTTFALAEPAPGQHAVQLLATDPETGYSQAAATTVDVAAGSNAAIPPAIQAAAALTTTAALGAWLWLEWMRNQQAAAALAAVTVLDEDGNPLERNEDGLYRWDVGGQTRWVDKAEATALVADAAYWDQRNREQRAAALSAHDAWAARSWDSYVDRCRALAAAEAASAQARRRDHELRMLKSDRLEDMAWRDQRYDIINYLERQVQDDRLPSWQDLQTVRNSMVAGRYTQDLLDARYAKSDVRFFAEGCHDTLAWGTGKVSTVIGGPAAGQIAEWMVRNPEVPLRIGAAALTAGKSELLLIPLDAWRNMEAAADRKLAEQNLNLSYWEATKECIRAGAWHVGGEMASDVVAGGWQLLKGGGAAGREAIEEAAEAAARRAARQTDQDFIYRVLKRQSMKGADEGLEAALARGAREMSEEATEAGVKAGAREAGEEAAEAAARRGAQEMGEEATEAGVKAGAREAGEEAVEAGGKRAGQELGEETAEAASRQPPDDWVRNHAREGEVIPRNHYHETGFTARDAKAAGRICAEENVEIYARTTNMDSMRHIRDGTALPKPLDIKAKTIKFEDTFIGARSGDEGLVGYFKPEYPDLKNVPDELHDAVLKRYHERIEDFGKLKTSIDKLKANGTIRIEPDGRIINNATGKPYAGDIDAVFVKDKATGKYLVGGPRYDRVMSRWRLEVGGQHGAEMNVIEDLTAGLRKGTPEYDSMLKKAQELQAKLQSSHASGKEVVIRFDADGALRRGPMHADINLSPDAADVLRETVDVRPPTGAPPPRVGGAVGSAIGREEP